VADVAHTHRSGRQSLRLSARDLPPLECMGRTAEEGGVPAVHELGGGGVGGCIPSLAFLTLIHGGPGTVDDLVPVLWRAAMADRCCSRSAR
jgi:hypothetical protein